jgi:hypothetical protein
MEQLSLEYQWNCRRWRVDANPLVLWVWMTRKHFISTTDEDKLRAMKFINYMV